MGQAKAVLEGTVLQGNVGAGWMVPARSVLGQSGRGAAAIQENSCQGQPVCGGADVQKNMGPSHAVSKLGR